MPGGAQLEVRIAEKRFAGDTWPVLRNVCFTVQRGERLALLAPSGTGKTSILRVLLELDADFDGSMRNGAKRSAAVFQEPRLVPWLSVIDNLLLVTGGASAHRIAGLLQELGLSESAKRWPSELSLGMARRVAIARALAIEPDLLVLDEPLASLDPRRAHQVMQVVVAHARRLDSTVVLATHDLAQALAFAERVLVLAGSPASLAADLHVPNPPAMLEEFQSMLRTRFPFLSEDHANPDAVA